MNKLIRSSVLTSIAILMSCEEREIQPITSNEALTTVRLELTNASNAGDKPIAQWEQLLDNTGSPLPADVSQANLTLKSNSTYTARLVVLDKTKSPVFDASAEIEEEGVDHLFFFQPLPTQQPLVIPNNFPANQNDLYPAPIPTPVPSGNSLALTITITDKDNSAQQYPIGLESSFVTGTTGAGWLRIVLRHQPGTKNGTYAPGSTDVDVGFNVTILN